MKKKYKSFILLVILLTCIGAVSASDIGDDNFNLDATDISDKNIGEISADSVNDETLNTLEEFNEDLISDGNYDGNSEISNDVNGLTDDESNEGTNAGNSDKLSDDDPDTVTTENGGIRNISFSDGYNGYCIDMTLHAAEAGQSFTVQDTSVIVSHIYNTPVGEYLKILFYNYYDEVNSDKEVACEAVWTFTDRYYKDSSDELVQKVIADYDSGLRVADHGAVKKINDTHEMVFDFKTYISSSETIQNFFGYKVSIREIENSEDNSTEDDSNETTDDNSTNETNNETNNETDDSTDDSNDDADENLDDTEVDDELDDGSAADYAATGLDYNDSNSSIANNKNIQKGVSGVATGNPLLILFISLVLLVFVPFRNKK